MGSIRREGSPPSAFLLLKEPHPPPLFSCHPSVGECAWKCEQHKAIPPIRWPRPTPPPGGRGEGASPPALPPPPGDREGAPDTRGQTIPNRFLSNARYSPSSPHGEYIQNKGNISFRIIFPRGSYFVGDPYRIDPHVF